MMVYPGKNNGIIAIYDQCMILLISNFKIF